MNRLIVMDMDGTLLNKEKKIPEKTKEALIRLEENKDILVLASGRGKDRLMDFVYELEMDKHHGYLIESNGSYIYDIQNENRHKIKTMTHEEAEVIVEYVRKTYPQNDIVIMSKNYAFINTSPYGMQNTTYNRKTIEQLKNRKNREFKDVREVDETFFKVCVFDEVDKVEEILKDLQEHFSDRYWCGRVAPFWIEITPIEISKGIALKKIMDELNVSKEDVYVFGDGENDLSMLEVGHSVAMGNALDVVKEKCEYVTLSNDEDGIAHFIEEYLVCAK